MVRHSINCQIEQCAAMHDHEHLANNIFSVNSFNFTSAFSRLAVSSRTACGVAINVKWFQFDVANRVCEFQSVHFMRCQRSLEDENSLQIIPRRSNINTFVFWEILKMNDFGLNRQWFSYLWPLRGVIGRWRVKTACKPSANDLTSIDLHLKKFENEWFWAESPMILFGEID